MDSLWQAAVYKFPLAGVRRHIYVQTVLDDRSRFLVMGRTYRRERSREATNTLWWGLKKGRTPKALYVDNGNCFSSKEFREYCSARGISVIYGRPYSPRGRGKLGRFHGILTQELVGRVRFRSLSGHVTFRPMGRKPKAGRLLSRPRRRPMDLDTYVGLDLSKTSTMATAVDPMGHRIEQAKLEPTDEALLDFLRALPPGRKHIVLEACNVWEHVYDAAAGTGAEVLLANPLQTKLITKATLKTDRVDSEKLALLARLDAVPESYAPSPEVRQLRRLGRERVFYRKAWTSVANHTYAVLLQKGIPFEEGLLKKKRRREALRGHEIPEVTRGLDALAKLEELLQPLEKSLLQAFAQSKEAQLVATVPGVGTVTAMTLVAFLCPIERFHDLDAVVKYCGLCPSTSQSGEKSYAGHLVQDCQSVLKWVLIEAQWQTRRLEKRGDVAKVGRRVAKRAKAVDGAVAAARKLVRICASVLRRGTPYQTEAPDLLSRRKVAAEP